MTIERKGKFLVDVDLDGHLSVGIESHKIAACIAEAVRRRAYGVFGKPYYAFKEDNLDFLTKVPHVRKVWFSDDRHSFKNIDGIYTPKKLKYVSLSAKRPGVDFARLQDLEILNWPYNELDTGLASLGNLRYLALWHYNPRHKSFEGLELPDTIEELNIAWANPKSLIGLPKLPRLKKLEIARCRNLETIAELPRITPNLEHLVVDACGRVADGPEVVRHLPRLHHAWVRDAVLVSRPEKPMHAVKKA